MSWIKSGENLYSHNTAPFVLEKVNETWGIRDTRDKSQFIPFSDIFNNPVFPLDLSNADVIVKTLQSLGSIVGQSLQILGNIVGNSIQSLGAITGNTLTITNAIIGKHFRGENAGGSATPIFSAQGDIDTGFYHISDGVFGWSSNGIKKGEFGASYGGFIGNVIQWINDKTQTQKTNTGNTYLDIEKGAGVSWEIALTPKLAGSKIIIIFRGAFQINSVSGVMGVRVLQKLNVGGSYAVIWKPEEVNTTAPFAPIDVGSGTTTAMYKNDYFIQVYVSPSYVIGDTLYFKFQFAPNSTGSITNNVSRSGNSGETSVSIVEVAQ